MHERLDQVFVLECSQVETPAQFWQLYLAELPVEGADTFGKSLDALWDALSAGGPGYPGAISIEVHNTEWLEAHDEGRFVEGLARIQRDLAAQDADVRLLLRDPGTPPRGRLYNHRRLHSRQLAGVAIERALRWQPEPDRCELLWLKPHGQCWQRLYLDVGIVVWEEWSDVDVSAEHDQFCDEVVSIDALVGESICLVEFHSPQDHSPELRLETDSGLSLRVFRADPADQESAARFELTPVANLETTWSVWRQDDRGQRHRVSPAHTRQEAETIARALAAHGPKQTYWAARDGVP